MVVSLGMESNSHTILAVISTDFIGRCTYISNYNLSDQTGLNYIFAFNKNFINHPIRTLHLFNIMF